MFVFGLRGAVVLASAQASRLNAESGSAKRRVMRYEREPPILKRDAGILKLHGAGLKREAPWVKRETIGLTR